MAKKSISEKRTDKERSDNQTLYQVFNVFLLGLAAECYLFIVYRAVTGSVESLVTCYQTILPILSWLGVAMLAAGAAVGYVKRTDKKLRIPMAALAGSGLFLAFSGFVMTAFSNDNRGVTAMCILVPILAVLGLVFLLYQHECFLCTTALSGGLFAVWVQGEAATSVTWHIPMLAGGVFGAVLVAVAAWLARKAQQNNGKLGQVRVFSPECDYRIIYGVLVVTFVCVAAAIIVPAISYYLLWALGIVLFAELVFYTTKLM